VHDSEVSLLTIEKYFNIITSKIQNSFQSRNLLSIIGSEADFFSQLKSQNFKLPLLQVLQFLSEVLETPLKIESNPYQRKLKPGQSLRHYIEKPDSLSEHYEKLIQKSEHLENNISVQKLKIAEVCAKVKKSLKVSTRVSESTSRLKPDSLALNRPYSNSPALSKQPIIEDVEDYIIIISQQSP